jgi:2-polyprenyl-6-methoxyphenol hydroxylase-like FAD-dependent oxidoreductase
MPDWDVIVVGARCAGSPTAMLLARRGHRVLVVDKATFPSDTISTHMIHPPGIAALARWGLRERLAATGCPAIHRYSFDLGQLRFSGSPLVPETPDLFCPRRVVLDKLLVDAAAESGAEVREGFVFDELVFDGDRVSGIRGRSGSATVTESARFVVGADGRQSGVARQVAAASYDERPAAQLSYYSYWSSLPVDGFETYARRAVGWAAMPTHDGLTLVVLGRAIAARAEMQRDVEGMFYAGLEEAPEFAARVRAAKREDRFYGMAVDGYFRAPFGDGWALVGDAAYNKDPITAQGISDAFLDAEKVAEAIDGDLRGQRPFASAMDAWRRRRDVERRPIYDFTYGFSKLEPPPPEQLALLGAVAANPESRDEWAKVIAGVLSPADFFAPGHVGKVFARAGGAQ